MVARATCICVLAFGVATNAYFLPGAASARSVTRSFRSCVRMSAGSEGDKAKHDAKKSLQHATDGQGSRAGDDVQNAAHHAKEAAKDALGNTKDNVKASASQTNQQTTGLNKGTDVHAAQKTAGVTQDSNERVWEAPVEKTRIHERVEEVDKTRVEEQRVRTEVKQVVQPIQDTKRRQEEVRSVDHGTEVRERGSAGLDAKTEAELKRRREELAVDAGTTRDKEVKQTSLRPDVERKEFVNTVEQVVPVIERDIYVPKKVEHEKKIIDITNEAPEIKATEIKEAISKEEFEKRYGGQVDTKPASTPQAYTTKETHAETSHTTGKAPTGAAARQTQTHTESSRTSDSKPAVSASTSSSASHQSSEKHSEKHESKPAGYSMSDVNMAHDAERAANDGSEGKGVVGTIKEKIKNILD